MRLPAMSGRYIYDGVEPPFRAARQCLALLYHLAARSLAQRYQGSALGFAWTLLNPLLTVAMYAFVFSVVLRISMPGVPYSCYFLTGYLLYTAISQGVVTSVNVIGEHKDIVRSCNFPVWLLPLSRVAAAFFNYLLTVAVLLSYNAVLGVWPGWGLLWLPVLVLLAALLSAGVALLLAGLTPYYRDISQVVEFATTILYFSAPVIYPFTFVVTALGGWKLLIYELNPFAALVLLSHHVFLQQPISGVALIGAAIPPIVMFVVGFVAFQRCRTHLHEVL